MSQGIVCRASRKVHTFRYRNWYEKFCYDFKFGAQDRSSRSGQWWLTTRQVFCLSQVAHPHGVNSTITGSVTAVTPLRKIDWTFFYVEHNFQKNYPLVGYLSKFQCVSSVIGARSWNSVHSLRGSHPRPSPV